MEGIQKIIRRNDSITEVFKMEKSLSNVSRKFKPISDNSWIFKEHSLEKFSMGKSKNSIKCNQNIDCNYDKENKNATEQKILNKLNRYSSNCFLSPGEQKMGKIMGSVMEIENKNSELLKSENVISQPNFIKNYQNFSNISINKNLASNQPFQKNLINEFQNLTEEKLNTLYEC